MKAASIGPFARASSPVAPGNVVTNPRSWARSAQPPRTTFITRMESSRESRATDVACFGRGPFGLLSCERLQENGSDTMGRPHDAAAGAGPARLLDGRSDGAPERAPADLRRGRSELARQMGRGLRAGPRS